MKRIVIGGLLGGIVAFLWGAISHMVLPLGEVGVRSLPNEQSVVSAMRDHVTQPGFYFFPGMAENPNATAEERKVAEEQWAENYRRGPSGVLVYQPGGHEPIAPTQLGGELVSDILAAMVAAMLLSMARGVGSFGARVLFVTLLGLFASLSIVFSYWIWYGFPADFTAAQTVDQMLTWFFSGLVLAAVFRTRRDVVAEPPVA